MNELLFGYGIRLFDALMILLGIIAAIVVGYLILRRHWKVERYQLMSDLAKARRRSEELEQALTKARGQYDPACLRALHDHLQTVIAHEFVKGLKYILDRSEHILRELGEGQVELRDKQSCVVEKVYDLIQHAQSVVGLFGLERESVQREVVSLKGLIEKVLRELWPYAEAQGVGLQPELPAVQPILVNSQLVTQVFTNVVHNAIKYSPRGRIVSIKLGLEGNREKQVSGVGLHYAREIARLHGGDVVLAESQINQGSEFKIVLPYR
jgi:signal transduction histidine kinase